VLLRVLTLDCRDHTYHQYERCLLKIQQALQAQQDLLRFNGYVNTIVAFGHSLIPSPVRKSNVYENNKDAIRGWR